MIVHGIGDGDDYAAVGTDQSWRTGGAGYNLKQEKWTTGMNKGMRKSKEKKRGGGGLR